MLPQDVGPDRGPGDTRLTSWRGSGTGKGWRSRWLNRENTAVLAPMPSASVSTATAVKPGARLQHAQCVADIVPSVGEELRAHHAPPPSLVDRHTFQARALDIAEAAQGQLARALPAIRRARSVRGSACPGGRTIRPPRHGRDRARRAHGNASTVPPRQPPPLEGCASNAAKTAAA